MWHNLNYKECLHMVKNTDIRGQMCQVPVIHFCMTISV